MKNRTQIWLENVIYALIWLGVFAVPIIGFHTSGGVEWHKVHRLWLNITPFLVLFVVNNYILIPYLLLRKRYLIYAISAVAATALLFTAIPLASGKYMRDFPPFPFHDGRDSLRPNHFPPAPFWDDPAFTPTCPEKPKIPPRIFMPVRWGPMLHDWSLAILLIGFNAAIGLMFRSIADARRMEELEHRSLRTELDHLKAQVNPHFLMNTLNNIHALIDIDHQRAKGTVIELSKIMRYMLYETDRQVVPLRSEVEFLKNYTSLMRIRYTGDVRIETRYPDADASHVSIPPLLLITLLENAFKHGAIGGAGSYITADLSVAEGRLVYTVRNSHSSESGDEPGVGLENLRKRLGLLYGENHSLEITSHDGEYAAKLTIPLGV